MPAEETIAKMFGVIRGIKKKFKNPQGVSLVKILRDQRIAHDYGKIFINKGMIKKTSKGLRGRTNWVWNNKFVLDKQAVFDCIVEYNDKRIRERDAVYSIRKERKIIMDARLENIEKMLSEILTKVTTNHENK